MKTRVGDVIEFRRGGSVKQGEVRRFLKGTDWLFVRVASGRDVRVIPRTVERIVVPVLTEKEQAAVLELLRETHPVPLAALNGLRRGRGDALISATTLRGLAQRGLIESERMGVTVGSGPMQWRLTTEGRRVARSL